MNEQHIDKAAKLIRAFVQNHQAKVLNIKDLRGSVTYDLGCDSSLSDEGVYPSDEKVYELFDAGICQVLMSTVFSERELATMLAGLRSIQYPNTEGSITMPHFDDCSPLTPDEIDALCERLN